MRNEQSGVKAHTGRFDRTRGCNQLLTSPAEDAEKDMTQSEITDQKGPSESAQAANHPLHLPMLQCPHVWNIAFSTAHLQST